MLVSDLSFIADERSEQTEAIKGLGGYLMRSRISSLAVLSRATTSLFALAIAASQVFAVSAHAQSASSDALEDEEAEIVVTATKTGQTVLEAPVSVGVVDAETIRAAGATNFAELSTLLPSVVFSSQQSPIQSNVGIRGVTTTGGSAALEPSVGIYIDGVFTDRTSIGIGDFNDIAAVEVLRGPQSTLFGNASPAGIINFVTRRPARDFGGEVQATYGNFDRVQIAGTVTGPLVKDALFGRLSGFYHRRDGYLNNLIGPDSNNQNAFGVRGRLLFDNGGRATLLATAEFSRSRQDCCLPVFDNVPEALYARFAAASANFPFVGTGVPFPRDQYNRQVVAADGRNTYDQDLIAVSLEGRLDMGGGHELLSISSFRDIEQVSIADIDFTGLNLLNFPNIVRKNQQISQELRITSPTDQMFSWLAGAYYFRKDVTEDSALVINPQTAGLLGGNVVAQNSPTFSDIANENFALFGEATLNLGDRFKLTGGIRYNYDDKGIFARAERLRANGTALSPIQTIPFNKRRRTGGEVTYRGVAEFAISDDLRTFVSYTRGYKAFGINDDANLLRNVPGADFFFDSEIVDNYEIGFKGSIPAIRSSFSIVAFRSDYDDFQALSSFIDANNTLRFFLQNAASIRSQGIEFDATVRPADGLTFTAAVSYVDAKFTDFPNAEGPTGPRNLAGRPLTDAPKWSASLVGRYETPISAGLKMFVQGDMFYRSSVFTDLSYDPNLVQKAYTKFNARIGIGQIDKGWSLEIFGRNLSDEITFGRGGRPVFGAVTNLLPFAGAPNFPVGQSYIKFTGEPRTYGLTARFSF
jgi:iron complex outermembrane receptor protein